MSWFRSFKRSRLLRWLLIIIAVFVVADYVLLPIIFAYFVTVPQQGGVGAAPTGFQAVSLVTADNVKLAAWYTAPKNGAVIVLIHGAGGSRDAVRPYAQMLVDHGFGVLALDLRGHGESGGRTNKLGWQGTLDVGAAITYLQGQADVKSIGGLGISLGGEALLGAVSTYPTLKAVVADGASKRSFEEFYAVPSHRNVLRAFPPWIMFQFVRLFTGESAPTPTILESITQAEQTRLLLIAAGNNGDECDYNQVFANAVNDRAVLWIAPAVDHTGAFGRYAQEYTQRVVDFYKKVLLSG